MLTEQQIDERRAGIGGSDAAVIFGVSPWCTEWELWADKTGVKHHVVEANAAMHWGNRLESVVLDEVEARHPRWNLKRGTAVRDGCMLGNLDGLASVDGRFHIVEAKTARTDEAWRDGVPAHYVAQVRHYCAIVGAQYAMVAVLIGGSDYREYELEFSGKQLAEHRDRCTTWWQRHVVEGVEPAMLPSDRIEHSVPDGSVLDADAALAATVETLAATKAAIGALEKQAAALEETIKSTLGSAVDAVFGGRSLCTWRPQTRTSLDTKALEQAHPDIAAAFRRVSTFRVLRLAK